MRCAFCSSPSRGLDDHARECGSFKGDFIVTGDYVEPIKFKSRREAKDWCRAHHPGSPITEVGPERRAPRHPRLSDGRAGDTSGARRDRIAHKSTRTAGEPYAALGQCQTGEITTNQNSKPTALRNGGQRQSKMQNSRKAIIAANAGEPRRKVLLNAKLPCLLPRAGLDMQTKSAHAIRNLGSALGDHRAGRPCPDHHHRRVVCHSMSYRAIVQPTRNATPVPKGSATAQTLELISPIEMKH